MNFMKSPSTPLFGDRRIHLHLGAHKTATTFLQGTLKKSNHSLLKQGILYLPLDEMRANGQKLTNSIIALSKAGRPSHRLQEFRSEITTAFDAKRLGACHTVLISDENMSVPLTSFLDGTAYEAMGNRFNFMREELGSNLHVFFSVRDYPGFLSSIYVEILRHKPYLPFGDFMTGLCEGLPSLWSEAYQKLAEVFGKESVTFWDFNETVKNPSEVLSMLTAGANGIEVDPTPARPGLSQRAVEFIRDFYKLPGTPLPAPMIAKVAERLYPPSKLNGKFDPWTPREKSVLHAHYLEELKSIPCRKFQQGQA
jgi:hypothetical protein